MVKVHMLKTQRGNAFPVLTEETALQRAREIAPRMRARADQCEAERKAPDETIAELKASGLIRLMQPIRYGGSELGRDLVCEIARIFARECGSQAWVFHVLVDHAWSLATYPEQAQEDVWGDDPDTLMSSSYTPTGKAIPVEGGFRLSGRFGFSSGIDHVSWVVAGGFAEGEPAPRHFLIPITDGEVIDDWQVNGLEGTGSKSFEVKDIFVPAHRSVPLPLMLAGKAPGSLVNTATLYKTPRFGFTSSGFAALAVGMAESLHEEWVKHVSKRGAAAKESTQIVAGHAALEIEAAKAIYREGLRSGTELLYSSGTIPLEDRMRIRGQVSYAVQLVKDAATRLYNSSGAAMVYSGNNMERQYRNVMAGIQHGIIEWTSSAGGYGATLLGIEAGPPKH
jgi:3-hydroxy-9,10-secoandrosta-1,3,5(10)-triene-9,17-dione monooxygenase